MAPEVLSVQTLVTDTVPHRPLTAKPHLTDVVIKFLGHLALLNVDFKVTDGRTCPPEAQLHDRAAPIPALVISPTTEGQVAQTLRLFQKLGLYDRFPLSIKSGGHGYFNGASCTGVMLNLDRMDGRGVSGDTLHLEPGCVLGQIVHTLARNGKAVPHGDCFGVGAGGHFLTAGWDLILARRYGLGCQSVIGGRVALWDGTVVDVDDRNHPELLWAMRGGAAAGVGVVTELRLRLIDEPPRATWRFTRITKQQLETCVAHKAFAKAANLPVDISVSFRFHFEPDQLEPVASFNIVSLLTVAETLVCLEERLGKEVTSIVAGDVSMWNEKSLLDLRMLPASDLLASNPDLLADVTPLVLREQPLIYWKPTVTAREMARSYFTSISHWVVMGCEDMLLKLYAAFSRAQTSPARTRMYALVIQGGGRMSELQHECSMPLGQALARFELHWDKPKTEEKWCRGFTDDIHNIMRSRADPAADRPYRGDIWLEEQAKDVRLDAILERYDMRFVSDESSPVETPML